MKNLSKARIYVYFGIAMIMAAQSAYTQDRSQGRSMVISRNGIVAAESPLAAQAGARILERGGNAVDAAIATNAMMGVVEPMMNGIGGDLFAIVYDAKANKLYGINASGWAPKGLTVEYLQKLGIRSMPQQGVNAITVPGAVDGWQKLADKFGRKKLAEDLATTEFADLRWPLVTNVDADTETKGSEARDALVRQVTMPVRWEESVRLLIDEGVNTFVEVGPGRVLSGLLRQIERSVATLNVEDEKSLAATVEKIAGARSDAA